MIRQLKHTRKAPFTVTWETEDSTERETYYGEDEAFFAAAELQAFSDCSDAHNIKVHHNGSTYRYAGWQPGMLIEFVNEKLGTSRWYGRFPEWDH